MKNLYKEFNEIIGGPPVIELTELEKAKELSAGLFVKCKEDELLGTASLQGRHIVDDRRIKVFVADIDAYGRIEKAVRLLRTSIPDLKIFAVGQDMTGIPEICTGFLASDPDTAIVTAKLAAQMEQLSIGQKAGGILGAAISLSKKKEYANNNILVYLEKEQA